MQHHSKTCKRSVQSVSPRSGKFQLSILATSHRTKRYRGKPLGSKVSALRIGNNASKTHPERDFKAEICTVQRENFGQQDITFTDISKSRRLPRHEIVSMLLHHRKGLIEAGIWKRLCDIFPLKKLPGTMIPNFPAPVVSDDDPTFSQPPSEQCRELVTSNACWRFRTTQWFYDDAPKCRPLGPEGQGWERWIHSARKKSQNFPHA